MHKIGIDLGGTKTEGILLDDNFEIIERTRVKTNQQEGYSSILDLIKNLVDDLRQKTDQKTSLGICTPGSLSKKSAVRLIFQYLDNLYLALKSKAFILEYFHKFL